MRASYLKGLACACIQGWKFEKAGQILEEIETLEDCEDIDTLMMLAECYIRQGKRGAEKRIDRLHEVIAECDSVSAADLKSWGDQLHAIRRSIGAILLYRASSARSFREGRNPKELASSIRARVYDIAYPASDLANGGSESRAIVVVYVISFMTELLETIKSVPGVDEKHRASMEAGCHAHIVFVCNEAQEYRKSLKFGQNGIDILETKLGAAAQRNGYYSDILHKLVRTHENLGEHAAAEECYKRAIAKHSSNTNVENGKSR